MNNNQLATIHEILYIKDIQNSCEKLKIQFYFLSQNKVNQIIQYFKKDNRRYINLHLILVKAASDPKKRYNRLVKQLLRSGLIPDFESSYGTVLNGAILQNNYSLFYFLLKYCNVNHKNMSGRTPLFYAAFDGKLEMVYFLIKAGAIVDQFSLNYQGEEVLPIQIIQNEEPSFFNILEFKNMFYYLKNIVFSKLIKKALKKQNFKYFNFLPDVHKLNFMLAKPLMLDTSSGDLVAILDKCIGRTTKLSINKFIEAMVTGKIINSDAINRAVILKTLHPHIKADSIYLSWSNVGLMSRLFLNTEKLLLLKDLLLGYSFNRHLILFSDSSFYGSLDEIVNLWIEVTKKIPSQEIRKILPKKPKSLTEIHWVLYSLKKEHMKKPVQLNQPMFYF
jgi:ankyrin repeat protein